MSAIAMTINDAAKSSGLSRTRIYKLVAEGSLDARRAGGRTIIMGESLRAYLESLPKAQMGAGGPGSIATK